jgi:hypothetical protein
MTLVAPHRGRVLTKIQGERIVPYTAAPVNEPTPKTDQKAEPRSRTPWYIAGAALVAAAAVVIALLVAGGGSDDSSSGEANGGNQEAFPPHVVRDSEIEAQESGSPERALLEWWQAFQFGDARGVEALTSEATLNAIGDRQLAQLVRTRGQGLQGIEVLGASEDGNGASVRAGLLTFQPEKKGDPTPTTPTASRPTTFAMIKQGDEWLFRETAFLEPILEGLKRSREEQQKQGEKQQTETQTETATETTATETVPE